MNAINKMFLMLMITGISACQGSKKTSFENNDVAEPTDFAAEVEVINREGPSIVIYKTIADFYDNVPVIMNEDRTEIISYPAPSDVYYKGKLAKPFRLKNGYLLDNRGINENVAFLSFTYEEYSKREQVPSLSELKNNIKEKYPLKELIKCGDRYQLKDEIKELNKLIDDGFPDCQKISLY
ncbi:MAG: hypothetical protein LIO93_09205 [Bacteroidales bacterium]|nr:hypothetical protein [Bacteroidales bacterium]